LSTTKKASLKVHQLAKELGVTSKDIIAKCQSEEIPDVSTHLSPISAGLAATIRDWFTGGGAAVAVETGTEAVPVDDSQAATPRNATPDATSAAKPAAKATEGRTAARKVVKKSEPAEAAPAKAPAPATKATPASAPPAAAPTDQTAPTAPVGAPVAPAAIEAVPPPVAPVPPAAAAALKRPAPPSRPSTVTGRLTASGSARPGEGPGGAAPAATPPRPTPSIPNFSPTAPPVMNVPSRPTSVAPAGPQLQSPTKTALSGPRVIRVEQPDILPKPRSASTGTGPGGPRTGTGTGTRTTGRRDDAGGRSGRMARGGGVPGVSQRDRSEREDRLNRSEGFFKQHRRDSLKKTPGGPRPVVSRDASQPIEVSEPITIKELSAATGVKAADILRKLFLGGTVANINSAIETEKAVEVMMDFDIELKVAQSRSAAEIIESRFTERERTDERPRAPVVTILGHVDHGKTSLLDRIRNTNVAAGEAGGITQATSAFTVPVKAGDRDRVITFIDTPGHEAFTSMRARGAKVTDIAILVVAADDGVMPQTIESITHAKAAEVPIVVALNKIDLPQSTDKNITRILGQLAEHGLNPVEWGGDVEVIRTSAVRGDGIQDLLDMLDYKAELLGLAADWGGNARGTVLEAQMEEGRGPVARVIVQEGLLEKGDFVVCGRGFGRVRDIVNDRGERIPQAGPSTPVAISGIDALPDAGDKFFIVDSLKAAEEAADERRRLEREKELAAPKITLDNIFAHLAKGQKKELALVVKADVQGSVEALRSLLSRIGTDEVVVSVKQCGVGGINESDVTLAEATKAIIVGFNVTSSAKARAVAETKGIEIRLYDVIYDLTDDVTKAASGLLTPELKLEVLGHAEVREVFKISKVGMIAGCYITDGTVERNAQIRVTRGGIVIEKDRRLEQLKRFKDDVKDVRAGQECGMKIVGYDDIKAGDVLECYKTIQVARTL
jgi:translation initiation factor IF-2